MVTKVYGTQGVDKVQDNVIATADLQDGAVTAAKIASNTPLGTNNLIINGNMQIAQRATSATGMTGGGYHTVDRMYQVIAGVGTWTITQDTDVPTGQGFASSLKYLCTTANASLTGTNQIALDTRIEGQNLQQLSYGTANAKTTTLSFWVKSNKTGTYTFELASFGGTIRSISKSYTIDSANTWEKKIITIEGDTSGALPNTNALGFVVKWWLGVGPDWYSGTLNTSWSNRVTGNVVSSSNVNLADSTANYINITGVQLETGTTATDFEHLQYGQQLALCQRYYEVAYGTYGVLSAALTGAASSSWGTWFFKQQKRASPTFALATGAIWNNVTPTLISPNVSSVSFNATNYFWATSTADTPCLTASSEL